MKIFICAGEASGDALGAHLLDALAALPDIDAPLEAFGMGGAAMRARGFDARFDSGALSVVGLVEVLRHLPRLLRLNADIARAAIEARPDVAVLIDVPDFNIRLARKLKAAGIPVVFYVGPSVWAWRPGRTRSYAPHIDKLLVLFPFEVPLWEAAGVDVTCVGHPLVDEIPASHAAGAEPRTVALLPGSRPSEIRRHLSVFLDAARLLRERGIADRFVLPVAPSLDAEALRAQVSEQLGLEAVELVEAGVDARARREAIARGVVALVASGTATLETALVGRPQVIRPFVKVAFLGLVNLIAGRQVAPELLQGAFRAERVADAVAGLMDGDVRARALDGNREVRELLATARASDRAAQAVVEVARRRP